MRRFPSRKPWLLRDCSANREQLGRKRQLAIRPTTGDPNRVYSSIVANSAHKGNVVVESPIATAAKATAATRLRVRLTSTGQRNQKPREV